MKIISASRRTDIPAFYGDWFMARIREGAAGCVNPFGGSRHTVSLRPRDVRFIVFWSKDFRPFLPHLETLRDMGYQFYFQFTITGLPRMLESNTPSWRDAVDTARTLADRFSPDHVLWRFDPIVFSSATPPEFIFDNFQQIMSALDGATRRCYFSYVCHYGKVRRNFVKLHETDGVVFHVDEAESPKVMRGAAKDAFSIATSREEKLRFAGALADEAAGHGITMHTCCGDYLVREDDPKIFKAHCIDGELISKLIGVSPSGKIKPTREQCGCWESIDIGAYDTCPHGCIYCYANAEKGSAAMHHAALQTVLDGAFSLSPGIDRAEFPSPDLGADETKDSKQKDFDF